MVTIRKWISLFLILGTSAAAGAQQLTITASGDCRDTELLAGHRAFVDEIQSRVQGFEVPPTVDRLGHPASRSTEELQRQLDGIRQQFYQSQYSIALQQLQDALVEVRRLQPGRDQWSLWVSAQLLNGLILHRLSRTLEGDEAYRQVLRVDPKYELSADYYAPSTRERFEKIRKELARATRVVLSVTSTPSGADVYVDGFLVGRTPFTQKFPAGSYQLALARDQKYSFPRRIDLQEESHQHVNLAFEGAVHVHPRLCIDDADSEAGTFRTAVNLAAALGTQQLAVLRLVRQVNGSNWLVATLINAQSGERIREGGIQISRDGTASRALGELTRFVVAGEPGPNVQEGPMLDASEPAPVPPPLISDAGQPLDEISEALRTEGSPATTTRRTWKTPLGIGLLAAGVASAGFGIPLQVQASESWNQFNVYYADGKSPQAAQASDVRAIRDRASAQQTQAIAAFAVGGAAVLGGAILLLIDGATDVDQAPQRISLQLSPQSTVVSISGDW